jgi:hypothetical protein
LTLTLSCLWSHFFKLKTQSCRGVNFAEWVPRWFLYFDEMSELQVKTSFLTTLFSGYNSTRIHMYISNQNRWIRTNASFCKPVDNISWNLIRTLVFLVRGKLLYFCKNTFEKLRFDGNQSLMSLQSNYRNNLKSAKRLIQN